MFLTVEKRLTQAPSNQVTTLDIAICTILTALGVMTPI
jgi:hypothetical protein